MPKNLEKPVAVPVEARERKAYGWRQRAQDARADGETLKAKALFRKANEVEAGSSPTCSNPKSQA